MSDLEQLLVDAQRAMHEAYLDKLAEDFKPEYRAQARRWLSGEISIHELLGAQTPPEGDVQG